LFKPEYVCKVKYMIQFRTILNKRFQKLKLIILILLFDGKNYLFISLCVKIVWKAFFYGKFLLEFWIFEFWIFLSNMIQIYHVMFKGVFNAIYFWTFLEKNLIIPIIFFYIHINLDNNNFYLVFKLDCILSVSKYKNIC